MKALSVAKKDFRDAAQSRALWALVGVFVVLLLITTYGYSEFPELFGPLDEATFEGLIFFTSSITSLFIPVAAIIVCFKSLAGERELGSIKILLSLPLTRTDALGGKLLGRAGVLSAAVLVGLVIALGFGAALVGSVAVVPLLLFVALSVGFAAVYVNIMVSLSALSATTSRAITYALGFFVAFELAWDVVPLAVVYVANGFSLPEQIPEWTFLVSQFSPSTAYFTSVIALLPDAATDVGVTVGGGGPGEVDPTAADPFYVTPEAGFVFLAFWLVVPVVLGYRRFVSVDL